MFPFFVIKDSIVTKLVDFHDSISNRLLMTKLTNLNALKAFHQNGPSKWFFKAPLSTNSLLNGLQF